MKPLDDIDRRILAALQRDGRITFQRLAREIALSPRPTLERVRRLERDGVISGYAALLDARRGDLVTVVAEVTLRDQGRQTQAQFERRIGECREVVACHLVSGAFDYVVRFACPSLEHYRVLTASWIDDPMMGVSRVASMPELKTIKEFRGYPVAAADRPGSAPA